MNMGEIESFSPATGRRIAVVGSGIAGLASAWMLSRSAQVTLFEASRRAGGHTNTVDVTVSGSTFPVDTGFLVFNRRTYPNLCAMLEHLRVPITESDMSFSVSLEQPDLEWSGTDLGTVFAQSRNLLRPQLWRMLFDIIRFNRATTRMALSGEIPDGSLGDWLAAERYSDTFANWYLLPMAAAIWSCPTGAMRAYPLSTFVRFCHNHGLLQVSQRPRWLTVRHGAREYVQRVLREIGEVRLGHAVTKVVRDENGVWVQSRSGTERFDELILACHSDQALRILGAEAGVAERRVLASIGYQPNRAVLHTDARLLPRRRKVWSSWNYVAAEVGRDDRPVSVSYLINRLQPLPVEVPVIVTLNPHREPAPETVLGTFEYAHPVFDRAAVEAQSLLPSIQGRFRTWYVGAWTGYGFHEDGLRSAIDVVERLGGQVPWRSSARAAQVSGSSLELA